MSAFPSNPSTNDEHLKGSVRFKWDGAKWKRLGRSFDVTSIASQVSEQIGGGGGATNLSYTGHISSISNMTYYLDSNVPTGRTVTEFYAIAGTGGCTAEISGTNGSISTIQVNTTGVTGSLSNTTLPEGGTLDLIITDNAGCYDFRFAVGYTQ